MANILAWIVIFGFVSVVYLTIAILNYAVMNDYVLYNLQNLTEDLENSHVIKAGVANFTQDAADRYRETNFHYDDIWALAYMILIIGTIAAAYESRQQNYIGFLSMLFYGIMFVLFIITIVSTVTNWFNDEILVKMLPDVVILLPKFYYYLDHIGVFSAVHVVVCLLVNVMNFDLSRIRQSKEKEVTDHEVL